MKGKLAEYFLFQKLERLREQRVIESVEWLDRDGQPDFVIGVGERTLRVECKNVRSGAEGRYRNAEGYKVELQKTRNSRDGTPTRGYRCGNGAVAGDIAGVPRVASEATTTLSSPPSIRQLECRPPPPDFRVAATLKPTTHQRPRTGR